MTLYSLRCRFRKKLYLKYLDTGSDRDTKTVPLNVYEYVLHVPGIGYDLAL